jgi:bifunctional DNase/RNase
MIKVKLSDLVFDENTQMGIMILEDERGRVLLIWIGILEAQSILFKMQNLYFPRPLTHDLIRNAFDELGVRVRQAVVTAVRDNTFYAELHLSRGEESFVVDCRPSDAVAVALRADAPIFVDEAVMDASSLSREAFARQQKDKLYRQLLEASADAEDDEKLKH